MKILFFDHTLPYLLKDADYPVGGWAVELSNWIRGLQAAGAEVEVLTWQGANEYVGRQTHVRLRESYRPTGGVRVLKYLYHHVPAIVAATRQAKPDVVIQACSGLYTGIMAFASRQVGVPFVHRLVSDCDVDDRLSIVTPLSHERAAFRWGMARAAGILCQNKYQADQARRLWPKHAQMVIHNPFIMPSNVAAPRGDGRHYVAWLGNFGAAKNIPLLVRVAESNPGLAFRVAGEVSRLATTETMAAVERLRHLSNVELVGYLRRSQVFAFLAAAKCLLTTSHVEGFSNTFLEAFSAGTPVIAPRRVDPDGVIADFGLGLVSEGDDDLIGLPAAIAALSTAEHEKFSERCRIYVRQAHDSNLLARRLQQFLETLPRPGVSLESAVQSVESPAAQHQRKMRH